MNNGVFEQFYQALPHFQRVLHQEPYIISHDKFAPFSHPAVISIVFHSLNILHHVDDCSLSLSLFLSLSLSLSLIVCVCVRERVCFRLLITDAFSIQYKKSTPQIASAVIQKLMFSVWSGIVCHSVGMKAN